MQQEPPVRQRHLWQLQLTHPRQPQPTDTVGSGGSYTARLQPHVTKGGTTQSPQHAWWPSCTPSGPLHGHQTGSEPNHAHGRHVEHGSLPQTHTEPQAVTVLAQPRHSAGHRALSPSGASSRPSRAPAALPHHLHFPTILTGARGLGLHRQHWEQNGQESAWGRGVCTAPHVQRLQELAPGLPRKVQNKGDLETAGMNDQRARKTVIKRGRKEQRLLP